MIIVVVLLTAFSMFLVERFAPCNRLPQRAGWYPRTAVLNTVQLLAAAIGSLTWDVIFSSMSLLHFEDESTLLQVTVGYLFLTFVYYWWHRARHQVAFLWRVFHQIHHSPARMEVLTSFYKHPIEIVANGVLSSFLLHVILGLSLSSVSIVVLITGLAELFYHWNIKTPHWVGYIIQRPESHRLHHKSEWHRYNYSDMPIWDMLFGTFCNPIDEIRSVGFSSNNERALMFMLKFGVHGHEQFMRDKL